MSKRGCFFLLFFVVSAGAGILKAATVWIQSISTHAGVREQAPITEPCPVYSFFNPLPACVYEVLPFLLESGPLLHFAASPTFTTVPLAHLARPLMIRRSVHVICTRLLCCESERSLHFSLAAVSHFGRLCVRNTSLFETTSVRWRWWKPQKRTTNLLVQPGYLALPHTFNAMRD